MQFKKSNFELIFKCLVFCNNFKINIDLLLDMPRFFWEERMIHMLIVDRT